MPTNATEQKKEPSITYTVLILSGIVLALFGAVTAVLGLGGKTTFEGKLGNLQFTTTSVGLIILIVGAVLSAFVSTRLPEDVRVFSIEQETFAERLASYTLYYTLLTGIGVIMLACSLIWRWP